MREILFRGKAKQDGKWQYGDIVHHDKVVSHIGQNPADGSMEVIELNPETVGQYTGLKDNNDVKIFEGDIVEFEDAFADCEGYHDHTFTNQGIVEYTKFGMTLYFTDRQVVEMDDLFYEGKADCKVVGNIYDNPELLNGDANG